jgi:tetratricopeptide (TPR) repeat protein
VPPPSGNPPRRRPPTSTGAPPRRLDRAGARATAAGRRAVGAEPEVLLLSCQSGPAAGRDFALEGDEVSIGRAAENAVSLPDTSVSRAHALLRRTATGWALSDLGSGNGTRLNGEPVLDETELSPGDVIAVGNSELVFGGGEEASATLEDTGPAPAPAPARRPPVRTSRAAGAIEAAGPRGRPPPRGVGRGPPDLRGGPRGLKRVLAALTAVLAVGMALLVGWKAIQHKRDENERARQEVLRKHQEELARPFQEAKVLIRQGKWTAARAKLAEVQEADPDFEPRQLAEYIAVVEREIPNQGVLDEAAQATAAGQLGRAAAALKRVRGTPQSEAPLRGAREALEARIAQRLGEARSLAAARDAASMEKLKALADDVLAARDDDRDALELKRLAEATLYQLRNPSQPQAAQETPWLEVQQRYRTADVAGAQAAAEACAARQPRCQELGAQIKDYEARAHRPEELGDDAQWALFELDRKIGGGASSDQSRQFRTQLASRLYVKASQAKTTGNWSRAVELARRALLADPGHVGAQSLVGEARAEAKNAYLRGYQLRETNPDEAIRLFKDVLNMAPPDDDYYQKAKARVAELQHP